MPDSNGATVLDDLPESVLAKEILVRLPSKDVLCCRAVQKSWRCATSTTEFMLAHHHRQPSLPIINIFPENPVCWCTQCYSKENWAVKTSYAAFCDDSTRPASHRLCPVLCSSPDTSWLEVEASCDGFLIVSSPCSSGGVGERDYFVCSPATRHYAPLSQLPRCPTTSISGFYRHPPSEEYRVLYWIMSDDRKQVLYNILTVGSHEPRFIYGGNISDASLSATPRSVHKALLFGLPNSSNPPVFHLGNLHWEAGWCYKIDIVVFDTLAETFWYPASMGLSAWLLEMDGTLALSSTADGVLLNFSVMRDYTAELWGFKFQINLSAVAAPLLLPGSSSEYNSHRVVVNDHELLIQLPGCLLRCDVDGRFIGSIECKGVEFLGITSSSVGCLRKDKLWLTLHLFQESMFPLPCFEMGEEDM